MKHFQGQSHVDDLFVDLSHHSGRKQNKQGTKLFAGCFEQMFYGLFQQRIVAVECFAESRIELFQFGSNGSLYLIEYVHLLHL